MMLVIGYGNPGRMDDGLGPAFAERISQARLSGVVVSVDYQLTVEHALVVSEVERVVFVDALIEGSKPFEFRPLKPADDGDLTSHSVSPAALLALAATLYGAVPTAFVLGIAGVEFGEVKEGLSPHAARNLEKAVTFFTNWAAQCDAETAVVG